MLSNNIRKLRNEKHLNQKELAAATGIGHKTISDYERGISSPDWQTIKLLADYFNVSSDYLLGLSDQRETSKVSYIEHLDDTEIEIVNELKDLSVDDKKDILAVIKYMKIKGDI